MSDGSASIGPGPASLSPASPGADVVGVPARIIQLPAVRRRLLRRRRMVTLGEWAALMGMAAGAVLLVLAAVVSLMAR